MLLPDASSATFKKQSAITSHKLLRGDGLILPVMTDPPVFEPTKIGKKIDLFYGYHKKVIILLNGNKQNP